MGKNASLGRLDADQFRKIRQSPPLTGPLLRGQGVAVTAFPQAGAPDHRRADRGGGTESRHIRLRSSADQAHADFESLACR